MTEKNWFIFKGDHHLGPFTFNEILNKVKLAELKNEELLWREGDADWKAVFDQEDIVDALQKEKEATNQVRRQLEDQARESQKKDFASKMAKEREQEDKQDEERVKAITLEKQKQRQVILEQEIARKKEMAKENKKRERLAAKQRKQLELLEEAASSPPPLPPLPHSSDSSGIILDEIEVFEVDDTDSRECIELSEVPLEGPIEEDFVPDNEVELTKGRSFYSSIALVVIVSLLVFLSYGFLFETSRSLAGLSQRDKDSLQNVSSRPFSGTAIHKLRPTADLNSLWLASNFPNEGVVYLRMESVKGRILGDGDVVIQANSTFSAKAALFKELEVIEGEGLVPGEYLYEIKGFQTGIMKNLSKGLGDLPLFRELKAFRPERSEFSFKGRVLVSSTSIKNFNSLLEKKKDNIEKVVLRPLKDRRQRLKTFMKLLNKVEEIYNNILGRITMGKSMHLFEKRYNKEVGPYLRDLIIDTNKVHISILNLDPNESKSYEEVMNFGKQVGHIASEMVTKTREIRRLGKAKTEVMKERFRLMVDELRKKGNYELRALNGTINKYEEEIPKKD